MGNNKPSSKSKLLAALGVIAIAVIALLWWRRGDAPESPAHAPSARAKGIAADDYQPRQPPPRPQLPEAQPPIIDEVVVEKGELCEGEENLITVRAHTANGDDDIHLRGMIAGKPGLSVPIVARRNRSPEASELTVSVFARDNTKATAKIPAFVVKDCVAPYSLDIAYRLYVNTNSAYEFTATVKTQSANTPFAAISYAWAFGDGTTETTTEPIVVHDFSQRPQRSLFSNLLVRVEASSATGDTVIGRRGIVLRNAEFSNLVNAGTVTLVVELNPRFPTIEDGVVRQGIRLWHHRPEPIKVERLRTRSNSLSPDTAPVLRVVSADNVLGTDTIPPAGITFSVELDANQQPDVRSIDYLLDGVSSEGYPVKSVFSVMKPSLPTAENHTPVDDPALKAKILRARELLGRAYVTTEDLWKLEREGAFADLDSSGEGAPVKLPPTYPSTTP